MDMQRYRETVRNFYLHQVDGMSEAFFDRVFPLLESRVTPDMTGYQRKKLQYETITEEAVPVLLPFSPFYHELGTMAAICDGCGVLRGHKHAGAWNFLRANPAYAREMPELMKKKNAQAENLLYLICGPVSDCMQHFTFNVKPLLSGGLKSVYKETEQALAQAQTDEERDFLSSAASGLLCMKRIAEKFAEKAAAEAEKAEDPEDRKRLLRIADSAAYTPWNAPRTFYEALNLLAFTRTVPGALEGVGYNTFGRPDVMLLPFYENDLKAGRMTKDEAEELIRAFLLLWDLHYDHDMKMVGYADHELENTYTLGGCDENGRPVWNDLTRLFLRITREEKILFPKIKVRFSADSPKEYLDEADLDVIRSTSAILYQNDDATIPALIGAGFSEKDARDYVVSGCWGLHPYGNLNYDHGNYINLLKAFEFSVHDRQDKMAECSLSLLPLNGAADFEEVYARTVENCRRLFRARNEITLEGKPLWHRLDPLPLTSAVTEGCLTDRRDLTDGGSKYKQESYVCVGFPNIMDSLLAIKRLCFDDKICSLDELLHAVRSNWEGYDDLRQAALNSPFWGQDDQEPLALAARFNHDLRLALDELPTLWGGGIMLGHLTYTEIRFWGEHTLATPDGRKNGDYFSQGLTPSRLHEIKSVTSVINSLAALDPKDLPGNTVVNIILPSAGMTLDLCEAFLRASAASAMGSLQLNCVSRATLLDAQKHPENYRDLIVRVCGFSARFTSLSPEWQAEVLSRNYYQ